MAAPLNPESLNLKVGFEIHQQLATNSKLFCNCRCEEAKEYGSSFVRKLRPTQSELGAYDPAAMFEFSKMHIVRYHAAHGSSCLVEADDEPPHDVNKEALEIALIFSLALHSKIMDEVHVMRKIVIDGSNTSGFQRTMLVASGGYLDIAGKQVGVQSICLEEDAAKLVGDEKGVRKFGLDRLGVPLVEIALEPVTGKPSEIMQVALTLGRLLRASKRVARGLGSIRQDINISVQNGAVVEVKGVQQLDQLVKIIEYEMHRQHGLIIISQKLRETNIDIKKIGDRAEDVREILDNKSSSKIVKKILEAGGHVEAIRVPGFAGMIGYEPYNDIRLGKELGKLVKFYDIDGVFHSDELPNYGITEEEVAAVKQRLQMSDRDAFVMLGGPKDKVKFASDAIIQRLKAAVEGVPAETRAATPDGKTVFLRPRPGGARMYPETDILPIAISGSMLALLADKVPKHWDEIVNSLAKKYNLNTKLASQIFDSDYLTVFEEIASETKIEPTFIAAKLTEDLTSLQRQGLDASVLTDAMIKDIFTRLDKGAITKESVALIFEKLMKNEPIISKSIQKRELPSKEQEEMLLLILSKIYLITKGYRFMYIPYHSFSDSLCAGEEERGRLEKFIKDLMHKNFIASKALGTISITHEGIKKIENLLEDSSQTSSPWIATQIKNSINENEKSKIREIQKLRYDILERASDLSEGEDDDVNIFDVVASLGIDSEKGSEKLGRILFYLQDEGLIKPYAIGGSFHVTDKGRQRVKESPGRIF